MLVVEIMTGVTRLGRGDGGTDCHASDVGHWLAMTGTAGVARNAAI